MPASPDTDIELMQRCGTDGEALAELFRRYQIRLGAFIGRMIRDRVESEDLVHETFIRIHRAAGRYQPRAAFSTFLFTVARNLCIDHLKKRRGLPMVPLDSLREDSPGGGHVPGAGHGEPPGREIEPSVAVETAESVARLRVAIEGLGASKREALLMRMQQGLPYAEIAVIVSAPVGTVKYRVHEAIRQVAEALGVPRDQVNVRRGG